MATTVGVPTALSTLAILDGSISVLELCEHLAPGIQSPQGKQLFTNAITPHAAAWRFHSHEARCVRSAVTASRAIRNRFHRKGGAC